LQRYGDRPGRGSAAADPDRAARWTIWLVVGAVSVVVIAVVLRLTVGSLQQGRSSAGQRGAEQAKAGPATVVDLGPAPGADLSVYIRDRRAALAAATGDRVAVVSLAGYSTEAQARALAGSLPVVALLVAPQDMGPSTVEGSLVTWARSQAAQMRADRDEIAKLLPTVDDAEFSAFYTAELDRLDKAASALNAAAPIVFGMVVRGPSARLQTLGGRPEVRLVDVGDGSEPGKGAAYRGLRPEETARANDPPTRPA